MAVQAAASHFPPHYTTSSISSSSTPVDPYEKEEKEPRHLSFDLDSLWTSIEFGEGSAHSIATTIATTSPELLLSISQYLPQEFMNLFSLQIAAQKDASKYKAVLKNLYLISIRNSKYNQITKDVDQNISTYFPQSKKENFQRLISEAVVVAGHNPASNIQEIEEYLMRSMQLCSKITETLNLFCYLDPEFAERIILIAEESKSYGGNFLYPNCQKHFKFLQQNLQIVQHERKELQRLKTELYDKSQQLRQKLAALSQANHSPSTAQDRKRLLDYEAIPIWNAGTALLLRAFRNSFEEKWQRGIYLPDPFYKAIRKASNFNGCRNLTFKNLYNSKIWPDFPEPYIHNVWNFVVDGEDDVQDLMSRIILEMPQERFAQLESDLRTSNNKAESILTHVMGFLSERIRGPIHFVTLNHWFRMHQSR